MVVLNSACCRVKRMQSYLIRLVARLRDDDEVRNAAQCYLREEPHPHTQVCLVLGHTTGQI